MFTEFVTRNGSTYRLVRVEMPPFYGRGARITVTEQHPVFGAQERTINTSPVVEVHTVKRFIGAPR